MQDLAKYLLSQLNKLIKTPLGISIIIHIGIFVLLLCNFNFFNIKKDVKIQDKINVQIINEKMLKAKMQKIQKYANHRNMNETKPQKIKEDFSNLMHKLNTNNKKIIPSPKKHSNTSNAKEDIVKLNNLLKNIEKDKKKKSKELTQEAIPENYQLSNSEEEEIKKQIYQNWYIPSGIKNADQFVIDILIKIKPDGSIFYIEVLNDINDKGFKIAAASAERAVQLSSPLKITSEKLRHLKEFVIRFNMKEALSQI